MRTLLVTGGIGSGKSAVCACLRERGIPVYDSDAETRRLYDEDPELVPSLEQKFSMPLRTPDGRLDRKKLAAVIFSDPVRLQQLEAVVHPAVLKDFLAWRERHPNVPFVVMESAIAMDKPLFDGVYDAVLLVTAPEPVRLERACRRDGADPEAVRSRMRAQHFDLARADAVVNNDLDLDTLCRRTEIALKLLSLQPCSADGCGTDINRL